MKNQDTSKLILKKLILFSIPLIMSGLLQQLFNWVDALIVGNVVGESALGGVGTASSINLLFVTTIVGFTAGLAVLFAQQYGEGKHQENQRLLSCYAVALTIVFIMIAIVGMVLIEPILYMIHTPEKLFVYAKDYLMIIFVGMPFLALYNTYSAVL